MDAVVRRSRADTWSSKGEHGVRQERRVVERQLRRHTRLPALDFDFCAGVGIRKALEGIGFRRKEMKVDEE